MENSMEAPWKTKNRVTMWSSNPTPGYISGKKMKFEVVTCTPVFIAALFTVAKKWKHPTCPLTDEWLRKI